MGRLTVLFTCGVQFALYVIVAVFTAVALVLFGVPGLIAGIIIWLCLIPVGFFLGMGFGLAAEALRLILKGIVAIVTFPLRWFRR